MSARRMILIVSQSFYPQVGGVSSFLLGLVSGLTTLGYCVHVLHFKLSESDRFKERYPQVIHHEIATTLFSAATMNHYAVFKEHLYRKLHGLDPAGIDHLDTLEGYDAYREVTEVVAIRAAEIIKAYRPEIVNVHDYQLASVLDVVCSAKKLLSLHTPILPSYSENTLRFLRELASRADCTVVSVPEYGVALADGSTCHLRVTCVPPFVDNALQSALADASSKPEIPDSRFTILSIQRFDAKAGQEQLLRGFAGFAADHPGSLLVLVGGGSFTDSISDIRRRYFEQARELTSTLGLENKVFFAGSIPYHSLQVIYRRADVFCLLSRSECFGLALSEAMARRVPAIVSDVGGLAHQLRHGIDGITVKVDDPEAVTQALGTLYASPALRAQYAASAYERHLELFQATTVLQQYHSLFQSL